MTPSNQGRDGAPSRRDERAPLQARSGAVPAPSSGGGLAPAAPRLAAGEPVCDWDAIYPIHDGLGPDELDIEVEFEEEWRDDWTIEDKRGVALIVALIVVAIVCYRLGELSALGWFS